MVQWGQICSCPMPGGIHRKAAFHTGMYKAVHKWSSLLVPKIECTVPQGQSYSRQGAVLQNRRILLFFQITAVFFSIRLSNFFSYPGIVFFLKKTLRSSALCITSKGVSSSWKKSFAENGLKKICVRINPQIMRAFF